VCVIVDADVASLVFGEPPHQDFLPVFQWLHDGHRDGCLVYGGRLREELFELIAVRRYILRLDQAGRARLMLQSELDPEEARLTQTKLCKSNDVCVIALARISGARTLCSHDTDLHEDFTNPRLISKQRGSVYQTREHIHLLKHTPSCGRGRQGGRR